MQSLDRFKSGYTGHKAQERANRDIGYKQHIPEQYYPKEWFPMFVFGGAYVLYTDVIDKLLTTIDSYTDYVLDIDDVFITGIIAEKAGVERHYDTRQIWQQLWYKFQQFVSNVFSNSFGSVRRRRRNFRLLPGMATIRLQLHSVFMSGIEFIHSIISLIILEQLSIPIPFFF